MTGGRVFHFRVCVCVPGWSCGDDLDAGSRAALRDFYATSSRLDAEFRALAGATPVAPAVVL